MKARGTFVLAARCKSNDSTDRIIPLTQALIPAWQWKRQLSVGVGQPSEKELRSVKPLTGRGEQGLAPNGVGKSMKGEYKPGLPVASANR